MGRVPDEPISSSANPTIKLVQSLRRRSTRQAERLFVVEGVRAVDDALAALGDAAFVLVREDADWRPPVNGLDVRRITARLFDRLADTETPQPVVGVFPFPELPEPEHAVPLYLLVDGVRDPGNLGTLLRSAAGAGVTAVLLGNATVDPFNGKVVRSAMGAHFRVPMIDFDEAQARRLRLRAEAWVLAEAGGPVDYTEVDWVRPTVAVVGSEATGPSEAVRALAAVRCSIPLANGVESLNAGVAGSIILFEAVRQRRVAGLVQSSTRPT